MRILVIEDELAARQVLVSVLSQAGYSVDAAADAAQARAKLALGEIDLALCDIRLPDGNGVALLQESRASGSDTLFVMLTAFASVESAVEALRAGAYDYIVKPVRHKEVLHRLAQIETMRGLREANRALRKAVTESTPTYRFSSAPMLEVDRLASKVAPTNSTVLITGESGTGKGMLARAIHEQSERIDGPFLAVNCSAIPEHLMESEFFGHVKGAFTGADRARKGLFVGADKGTLFFDEMGELPLHMQTKLLNVIEDKAVRPVGGGQVQCVDTRIIAATNRNLKDLVTQGRFREDLYFRLGMFHIEIPPLRERRSDLRGLIQFFLQGSSAWNHASGPIELEPEAEELLLAHHWPGNVRELENAINRARILAEGTCICVGDLPTEIARLNSMRSPATGSSAVPGQLRDQIRRIEANLIRGAIEDAGGDRKLAAQRLGISLSSLYGKLSMLEDGIAEVSDTGHR